MRLRQLRGKGGAPQSMPGRVPEAVPLTLNPSFSDEPLPISAPPFDLNLFLSCAPLVGLEPSLGVLEVVVTEVVDLPARSGL